MWWAILGAVAAALASGEDPAEARRRRKLLGLGDEQGRLPLPTTWMGDGLVPVCIYADGGGIWRVVTKKAFREVMEIVGFPASHPSEKQYRSKLHEQIEKDLDPSTWQADLEMGIAMSEVPGIGGSKEVYVYVEPDGKASIVLAIDFEHHENGEIGKAWYRSSGDGKSKGQLRLERWADESAWATDDTEWNRTEQMVLDRLPLVLEVWKAESRREGDRWIDGADELAKKLVRDSDRSIREVGVWAERWVTLRDMIAHADGLVEERDMWEVASPDDDGILEQIRESHGEEAIREIEEEAGHNSTTTFDQICRQKLEDISDQQREAIAETRSAAEAEVDAARSLLQGFFDLDGRDAKSRYRPEDLWELRFEGQGIYTDPIDKLFLRGLDDGKFSYDLEEAGAKYLPEKPGALRALWSADYLVSPEEREKNIGQIAWRFPGPYQGQWELMALLGTYQPTGNEPLLLFLKIAYDHGLLEESVSREWEKLLLEWSDPEPLMRAHGLLRD